MVGFSWQQLGAFVSAGVNLSDAQLDGFASVGGKYIIFLLYGDDAAAPWNLDHIDYLKGRATARGIRSGAWINCWGGDPVKIADDTAAIVKPHGLAPVVLDCEGAYQLNTKLSPLAREMRRVFPLGTRALGVSTNSLNDSQVWNGRIGPTLEADAIPFRQHNIHVSPQWYDSPTYGRGEFQTPDLNMKYLLDKGAQDNFYTPKFPDHRSVPPGTVQGTLEITGLEGSDLEDEMAHLLAARQYGYTKGLLLYLLENEGGIDWPTLAKYRGILYTG